MFAATPTYINYNVQSQTQAYMMQLLLTFLNPNLLIDSQQAVHDLCQEEQHCHVADVKTESIHWTATIQINISTET